MTRGRAAAPAAASPGAAAPRALTGQMDDAVAAPPDEEKGDEEMAEAEEAELTVAECANMKKDQLKVELSNRRLSTVGNKNELLNRLLADLRDEPRPTPMEDEPDATQPPQPTPPAMTPAEKGPPEKGDRAERSSYYAALGAAEKYLRAVAATIDVAALR